MRDELTVKTTPAKITNYNVAAANVGFGILFGAVVGMFAFVAFASALPIVAALIVGGGLPIVIGVAIASRTVTSIVLGDPVRVSRVLGRADFARDAIEEVLLDVREERAAGHGHTTTIGRYLVATITARTPSGRRSFTVKISGEDAATLRAFVGDERIRASRALTKL